MNPEATTAKRAIPWNKGKVVGQKAPLKLKEIWAIRIRLQLDHRTRELALFNLAIDSKLRGCDLVGLRVHDVIQGSHVAARAIVMQQKTQRPVQFEITEQTRDAVAAWIAAAHLKSEQFLFPSRVSDSPHLSTRQYSRIVRSWTGSIGLDPAAYGTHSMRRTKPTLIYRRTKNLRAVQLLLGHTKLDYLPRRTMSRWRRIGSAGRASASFERDIVRCFLPGNPARKESIMERSYESAAALAHRAVGPLADHLDDFVASLTSQRYAPAVVYIKALHAVAFDRWLAKRRVTLADLGEIHIQRYQRRDRRRHRSICAETRRRERYDVSEVLQFLRARGGCKTADVDLIPADVFVVGFEQHLQHHQGLAAATIETYRRFASQFLHERFGAGEITLHELRPIDTIEFVQRQAKRMQPPALKCVVNAMRSFLRYAQYRGEVASELVAAVPAVATWTTTPPLPRAISPEHAQRAIDSCDLRTSLGLRDRAVLLLLARLGLRAHEIIALRLDDCDWDAGCLRVRSKGGRECLLPMPVDVGEAIAAYLERGRPTSADRHLFLRSMAPIRGFLPGSYAIGSIVRYALRRANVDAPHTGSHQFRHALAVGMLKRGASFAEIGEVLRHRSPQTTSIYARVDISALRSLAPAWPGGAR